nr:hypothetical protein [uncultured Arsenicibacter sp.]
MSTQKTKVPATIKTAVKNYLKLAAQKASIDAEMKELKDKIDTLVDDNAALLVDGKMIIDGVGLIKTSLNPPKLQNEKTGKPLTEIELVGLANLLGDPYVKTTVNVVRLRDALEREQGKDLAKRLKKQGVAMVQDSKYEVKKG